MPDLFSIPIPPCGPHPGGSIVCSEPRPAVYLLTWHSPPDNRITTAFCNALLAALDVIEFGGYTPGVVITTSAIPKFYSNGLDLEHAMHTDGFWALFYSVWKRFLIFPMPTVALLNGHTFAGGLMLSMAHDYRLAPSAKGYLCLNEVLFGAPLKSPLPNLFRDKLTPQAYRTVALEGRRMSADDAIALGVADDKVASLEEALRFIDKWQLMEKPKAGVYGVIKMEMYNKVLKELEGAGLQAEDDRYVETLAKEEERKEFGKVWYEQWQKDHKAKL